jgi:uncharacterized protein DUF4234
MAETVQLPAGGHAKVRNLWLVALLLVVTLGIYYLFWYYWIRRELRDFGRVTDPVLASIGPGMGVVAMTFGWYILVPPFVSAWRTVKHVKRAETLGGIQEAHSINHALGFMLFVLGFLLFPVEVFYLQLHLNRLWRHVRDEELKRGEGMRGEPRTYLASSAAGG